MQDFTNVLLLRLLTLDVANQLKCLNPQVGVLWAKFVASVESFVHIIHLDMELEYLTVQSLPLV